ncbi:MAG: LysR family transcriptional regulator [Anaerolineaceae bacterium]|nr:LysR family transcriptional regulator [Anaerolineaceae bacterium]
MDLKQLAYFVKVAELESFSAAADELYISQSSLSKQIMALEKNLGVQLFDRSKRQITITPAGKAILPHTKKMIVNYQSLIHEVAPFKITPTLSIIAIPVIAQYNIASLIARFKKKYPDIQLLLEEREAAEILPALNSHEFDLGFLRDNYLDKNQYDAIEVSKDKFMVIFSKNHPFAKKKLISMTELSDENFIMFDKGTSVHELTVEACHQAGFEPRIFYASLRIESILGLVASNSGVALMMEKIVRYHKRPDVVAIPLQEQIISNMVFAWSKKNSPSKQMHHFIDFLKNEIKSKR